MNDLISAKFEDPPDAESLIFHWRGRPFRLWRLTVILFGSLLAHAATFYLFQIAYTPAASLQPPSAQIVLLAPEDQAQSAALNQWLRMADPALSTSAPSFDLPSILRRIGLTYKPSYTGAPPSFKPLEASTHDTSLITPARSRPPGPVPATADEFRSGGGAHYPPTPSGPTAVVFRGPIEALAPAALPAWKFVATAGSRPLEPSTYVIGLRPSGGSPWLFRQPLSGDTAPSDSTLDEAARDYLEKLVFRRNSATPNTPDDIVWGWATFYWGREVYR